MKKLGFVMAGSLLSLGAFAADEGVTLGGYVDTGWSSVMQDKSEGVDVTDKSGFKVNEGAIYLGKKWGTEWEVFGDFSFNTDVDGAGSVAVSQAFVAQMMDNGFGWKLGKFDGVYGYYAGRSDSHAHHLNSKGYIQNAYLPASHVGWMGSYSFSDMLKFNVLVANDNEGFGHSSNGPGLAGSGTSHPDFGLLVNADFDAFSADLGAYFMTGESVAASPVKSELGYVVSAVVEGNLNPINFGVFGVYAKNDAESKVAPNKNSGDFGIGAIAGYNVNDHFSADLRLEYVATSDKTSFYNPMTGWTALGGNVKEVTSVMAGTIGGQWKFNENVKAKLDYTYLKADTDSNTGLDGDVDPFHIVQVGVVANF